MEGPRNDDAFGQMLQDCLAVQLEPGRVFEVVERSDGWISVGDPLRYFAAPDQWPPLERWGCAQARGRVLDIGAGAGRHALYCQQEGSAVVALDPSPLAIETCRQRGVKQLVVGTIETLTAAETEPFETVLLLGNNLGLLRDRHYAPTFLAHLASLATTETLVIGQGRNPLSDPEPGASGVSGAESFGRASAGAGDDAHPLRATVD